MKRDVDDTMIATALETRVADPGMETMPSPTFPGDFEELVAEALGDEELKSQLPEQKAAAARKQVTKEKLLAASSTRQGAGASSSAPAAAPTQATGSKKHVPFVPGRGLSQAEAKTLFPPETNPSRDLKHHFRWIARADWLVPAVAKTFRASEQGTDNSALLHCLSHAWARHTALTGMGCPWKLDVSLLDE